MLVEQRVELCVEFTPASNVLRAQRLARERALAGRVWPDIRTVAPNVPRWRYQETLSYVERIDANIQRMDPKGRVR